MKRLITLLLASTMLMTMALTSCSDNKEGSDTTTAPNGETTAETEAPAVNFEGTLSEILASITKKSGNDEIMSMEETLTAENSEYTVGLTADQLSQYVDEGLISAAMINVNAHLISLFKAKDAEAAKALKDILAEQFDSHRWVCVIPDKSAVIEAGEYVLLAVSTSDYVDNMVKAFSELAGDSAGEVNVFFTGEEVG